MIFLVSFCVLFDEGWFAWFCVFGWRFRKVGLLDMPMVLSLCTIDRAASVSGVWDLEYKLSPLFLTYVSFDCLTFDAYSSACTHSAVDDWLDNWKAHANDCNLI